MIVEVDGTLFAEMGQIADCSGSQAAPVAVAYIAGMAIADAALAEMADAGVAGMSDVGFLEMVGTGEVVDDIVGIEIGFGDVAANFAGFGDQEQRDRTGLESVSMG